jgi:hypothetical protein
MENAPGVARCVFCGKGPTAGVTAPPQSPSRSRLAVLLGLLLAAVALWRFGPLGRNPERDCQGGATAEVVWRTPDEKAPRLDLPNVYQIDPRLTPYIELARLRTTGTRRYGDNNDHQLRHLHQGVVDGLHAVGANAYFHAPSRQVGQDLSETVTSAVLAHPGPIKRAVRDQYFPGGLAAMVFQIAPGSTAEQGGLRVNDLVVRLGSRPIDGTLPHETLVQASAAVPSGGRVELEFVRDGEVRTVQLERKGDRFGYWSQTVPILEVVE